MFLIITLIQYEILIQIDYSSHYIHIIFHLPTFFLSSDEKTNRNYYFNRMILFIFLNKKILIKFFWGFQ
jgi:hypothetical protein